MIGLSADFPCPHYTLDRYTCKLDAVNARRGVDDDEPLTLRRALRGPEFWLLVATGLAGTFGVPWWLAVPLATIGLSISSLPKYLAMWPRVRAVGAEWEWVKTIALSVFNNLGAACASFLLGMVVRN